MAELDELLDFAHHLADLAGAAILPHFREQIDIDNKKDGENAFDPVTEADKGAEAVMRAAIRERYPDHHVLGEEEGGKIGAGYTWVLDPIDGTRGFISGMPTWGTLIALNDGSGPVLGILDQPYTKERFVGTPKSATLNGNPLRVRDCAHLSDAILFCTDPDMFHQQKTRRAFDTVADRVRLRRFGADCYAYGLLAMGMVDLVIEGDMKAYDIQALIPLVEAAGGLVTTWDGGRADDGGLLIAAGDKRVYDQAIAILQA